VRTIMEDITKSYADKVSESGLGKLGSQLFTPAKAKSSVSSTSGEGTKTESSLMRGGVNSSVPVLNDDRVDKADRPVSKNFKRMSASQEHEVKRVECISSRSVARSCAHDRGLVCFLPRKVSFALRYA
jgi:hypothetical protein